MKKGVLAHLFLMFFAACPMVAVAVGISNDSVLCVLDKVIGQQNQLQGMKEQRIGMLKDSLQRAGSDSEGYRLSDRLFHEYLHYQTDSALYYIKRKELYLDTSVNKVQLYETMINRAEVMGLMGMYNEALTELMSLESDKLSGEILNYYYRTIRACYGWIADYTPDVTEKQKYIVKTAVYRDSIIQTSNDAVNKTIVQAEQKLLAQKTDEAIALLLGIKEDLSTRHQHSYLNYTLSEAYEMKGDRERQIFYMAKAAISDLKLCIREYASLHKLARLIYETGDVGRAYGYLNRAMEDAVASNSRLRYLEVTEVYPIVDKAYKEMERQEKDIYLMMLVAVSLLAVMFVAAFFYTYHWAKKLSRLRCSLSEANAQLTVMNTQLEQTGKIKEVYIARYLDRCVSYLDKLAKYRRSLEKLAMASKIDDLFRAIRSEQFLKDERKDFYTEFDKSFLALFPNFIDSFNELLVDEERIFPKSGELLNTELRIFALIRLGVTDSNRIVHFLGYSLATIYNYRSKIRNKAKGDKEQFEQHVMNL